ncbi:MAG: carbohydrate binding family 9 domain-containing protein [Ignavibacteriales bacterium]|nr:carbohydrate binding family 9 domain-containing protein [Ignavibacteriales bacterium]
MKEKILLQLIMISFISCCTEIIAGENYLSAGTDSTNDRSNPKIRTYVTTRTGTPPEIDGKLDDECWSPENWHDFIYQKEPIDGGIPTEKTTFKVVYDDDYIYTAIRAYDSEPEKISKILSARDKFIGDLVGISIDSYLDRRTAFEFDLTAAGAKMDLIITNGNELNFNWNPIWDGIVGFEDSAWTVEMRVPFSQLRFLEKDEHTWGFMVWRWIYRKGEEDDWGYNPISKSTWVDQYGDIKGLTGIKSPSRIELLPYTLGKYHSFKKEEGNPFKTGHDKNIDFGLDGKIGIPGGFNLDLTINPDFGQVEADPSQISLSSYELEYEEKRPFFIEGNDILSFPYLYYPRRIGHVPSYSPTLAQNQFVEKPDKTTILSAAKITGKTNDGLSIGVLESVTNKEIADVQTSTGRHSVTVEPLTNYFVGRIQKELNRGNIIYGAALTAVNRKIDDDHLNFLPDAAYTGGLDFTFKWDDKNYSLYAAALFSYVKGDKEAIKQIQLSPAHYFQRPDADYLEVDENKTSLAGYGAKIELRKSGGYWRFSESIKLFSTNFEVNDIGYLPQVDRIYQSSDIGYLVQTPVGIVRNYSVFLNQGSIWNFGGDNYEFKTGLYANITFVNRWFVNFDLSRYFNSLSPSLIWGGPLFKMDGYWNYKMNFGSDHTRQLSFSFEYENRFYDDDVSKYYHLSPSFTYRITDALSFSGNVYYDFTRNNLQYIETQQSGGKEIYFLGKIDQDVYGITARVSFYITPDLSIQYYGSPFSAARKYSSIKKVTDPLANNYNERFHTYNQNEIQYNNIAGAYLIDNDADGGADFTIHNPDMSFREFRSNFVLKWEYNPGSTIYLVWSQNRSAVSGHESLSPGQIVNRIFDIYPDNIFIIKLNHWFSL